jgi:hypothetical protein
MSARLTVDAFRASESVLDSVLDIDGAKGDRYREYLNRYDGMDYATIRSLEDKRLDLLKASAMERIDALERQVMAIRNETARSLNDAALHYSMRRNDRTTADREYDLALEREREREREREARVREQERSRLSAPRTRKPDASVAIMLDALIGSGMISASFKARAIASGMDATAIAMAIATGEASK